MKIENIVYLNGKYINRSAAKISFLDRGFLYGDGIFDTMRAYSGTLFKAKEHIQRLNASADKIFLKIPLKLDKIIYIINRLIKLNKLSNAYIRISVTRGCGEPGLDFTGCSKSPTIVIYTKELKPYPERSYKNGVKIVTLDTRKNEIKAIDPLIKSCNFLNNIMAAREAGEKGAFEGILLSGSGWVTEGSVSNVFVVKDSSIITPSLDSGVLDGITRKTVMEIAQETGIKKIEKKFKTGFLEKADECFLTNSIMEIMPVCRINDRKVANGKPGKVTRFLMDKFKEKTGIACQRRGK